jgi:tetratricopeptide (TPR) repeat protein
MKPFRVVSSLLPILVLLGLAMPSEAEAQSAARVLVAPLTPGAGIDKSFGEKVAEEVGKSLENFDAIEPMEDKEIEAALKRFGLEDQVLTPVQWRQLASQLNADLVMVGNADPAGAGVQVKARFVQAKSGEELLIPDFTVGGDGGGEAREASRRIIEAFDAQVAYLKALQFCQDDPAKEDAIQSLAYSHAQLGNADRATDLYMQYLDFNPDDAEVRLNVAFNLAQAGAYESAIQIIQDGLERDPENEDLLLYLGNVALAKATQAAGGSGNGGTVQDTASAEIALDAYRRYVELEDEEIEAAIILNALKAHMAMDDNEGAFDLSERIKREMEETTDPVTGTGASVTTPGGRQLEVANITDADRATYWALRSDMLADMGRTNDAVRELGYALEIDPTYPNGYLKRGILHLQGGAPMETALADFRRAVESGSDSDVVASQLLAKGYNDHFKQGRIAQAITMFRAALEFATLPATKNQLNFFIGYGIYQQAVALDESNPQEECGPAQRALQRFQQVSGFIRQAGNVQQNSQAQILDATDTYIFRQEQIVKKACRG